MADNSYPTTETATGLDLNYYFISIGDKTIIKVIQYTCVGVNNANQKVFNLGLTDYDWDTGTHNDQTVSDNGDAYKVFRTVLNTIPRFFELYPNEMISVSGSDSSKQFVEACKITCDNRKCASENNCKKQHQRITVYRKHIEAKFEDYKADYQFYGATDGGPVELFEPGREYVNVFVKKKK